MGYMDYPDNESHDYESDSYRSSGKSHHSDSSSNDDYLLFDYRVSSPDDKSSIFYDGRIRRGDSDGDSDFFSGRRSRPFKDELLDIVYFCLFVIIVYVIWIIIRFAPSPAEIYEGIKKDNQHKHDRVENYEYMKKWHIKQLARIDRKMERISDEHITILEDLFFGMPEEDVKKVLVHYIDPDKLKGVFPYFKSEYTEVWYLNDRLAGVTFHLDTSYDEATIMKMLDKYYGEKNEDRQITYEVSQYGFSHLLSISSKRIHKLYSINYEVRKEMEEDTYRFCRHFGPNPQSKQLYEELRKNGYIF